MTIIKDLVKSIFGKDYTPIWKQFSLENNGEFFEARYGEQERVEIAYLKHTLIFDRYIKYQTVGGRTYDTEFTRIRLELKTPDELRFKITKQDFINTIGKFFGAQDVEIGDPEFDKKHMIKSNNEIKMQIIFSHPIIKSVIASHSEIQLELLDEEGIFYEPIQNGNAMLYYLSTTTIKDIEQLRDLLQLYKNLVNQLQKTASIEPIKQ